MISVLMAAYNAENTIRGAIISALNALPLKGEVLVYDDASTDSTSQIIESFTDSRLRKFSGEVNIGAAAARNFILYKAEQPFVAILDADDYSLPRRFSHALSVMHKCNIDFYFQNAILLKKIGRVPILMPQPPFGLEPKYLPLALSLGNPLVNSSMVCKRSKLVELGGYANLPSEDYDLWLRVALADMKISKGFGYSVVYQVHAQQVTSSKVWQLESRSQMRNSGHLRALRAKLASELQVSEFDPKAIQDLLQKRSLPVWIWEKCISKLATKVGEFFVKNG